MSKLKTRYLNKNELVEENQASKQLPVVIEPTNGQGCDFKSLLALMKANKPEVEDILNKKGAILLRGFQIKTAKEFEKLSLLLVPDLSTLYMGGLSPRHLVSKYVFTSTEAQKDVIVYPHNELSYLSTKINRISFFCQEKADKYGETPIYNCKAIYKELSASLRKELEKGVRYELHYPFKRKGFGRQLNNPWTEAFYTTKKGEVEAICEAQKVFPKWDKHGRLTIDSPQPAIIKHPVSKHHTTFLQLLEEHFYRNELREIKDRYSWMHYLKVQLQIFFYFKLKLAPVYIYRQDGSKLPQKYFDELYALYTKHRTLFNWQPGDVLLLDNFNVGHGRLNVVPPRKVLATFGRVIDNKKVEATPKKGN